MSHRLKRRECISQWLDILTCVPAIRNEYYCDDCDEAWTEMSTAAVSWECPSCDVDIKPTSSTEIAECFCDMK